MIKRVLASMIVLMLGLGPFAQAWDLGEHGNDADVGQPDTIATDLRYFPQQGSPLSDIHGHFTENLGQLNDDGIRLYCIGRPLSVAFGAGGIAYDYRPDGSERGVMFRVHFNVASPVAPTGVDALPHKNNYFIGNDPEGWITGVSNYREVVYRSVYDGIDLRFRLAEGSLKYDFIVGPGADPMEIRWTYEGVEGLSLDPRNGDLCIRTAAGTVRDEAPRSIQDTEGDRAEVESAYSIHDDVSAGFIVDKYDDQTPLVIDPGLNFSTFVGGTSTEDVSLGWGNQGLKCTVDSKGCTYVCGETYSDDFPTTPGAYDDEISSWKDAFVVKLNENGSALAYATYFGGSGAEDCGNGIAVDANGCAYVAGCTNSPDFPTTPNVLQRSHANPHGGSPTDGILLKLTPSGDGLVYSTHVGGTQGDRMNTLYLHNDGSVYLTGFLHYDGGPPYDFPVPSGGYEDTYNGGCVI